MKAVFTALCLTLTTSVATAGVIVETIQRDGSGKEESSATLYAQDGKLRIENRAAPTDKDPGEIVIFKDDAFTVIDTKRKTYTTMDRATMQRLAGRVNDAMKQMEEQLASMPPAQRAAIEKAMGKMGAAPGQKPKRVTPEFRKTGKTDRVADQPCQLWEASADNDTRWEHCVVAYSNVTGSQELMEAMKKMSALLQEMYESMDAEWIKNLMRNEWEGLRTLDGFPVRTRSYIGGKLESETALKSSRSTAIPADRFAIPAGYKRQDLGGA